MISLTINKDTTDTIKIIKQKIDNIDLFQVSNVISYSFSEANFTSWNIIVPNKMNDEILEYYFVIDLCYHETFGHWIYESCIYLDIFIKLKEKYPNLKLLLKQEKIFKSLILDFFNIKKSDTVYKIENTESNIVFFPSPISALNSNEISDEYKYLVNNLVKKFDSYETAIKKEAICIMPRQRKENFKINDRVVEFSKIIDFSQTLGKKIDILETDTISDIREQIKRVRESEILILSDGAAFHVNAIFCKNKTIFVNGNMSENQKKKYIKLQYIIEDIISNRNKYYYCVDENDIVFKLSNTKLVF